MKRPLRVGYSPAEAKLLKLLQGRKKPMTSTELCEAFYQGELRPWHAQGIINVALRSLVKKVEYNREDFTIERTDRRGPYPIEFRVVPRTKRSPAKAAS